MKQLALDFAPPTGPTCGHGVSILLACPGCVEDVRQGRAVFAAQVAAGKYNARGYTKREWVAAGHPRETWATERGREQR